MDVQVLLKLTCGLGYELAINGAETFRVEESISRILEAYQVQGEVYAVPNMLLVSVVDQEGNPITKMQRIGTHGIDLDAVERFSGLSRRICQSRPTPQEALSLLQEEKRGQKAYLPWAILLANFFAAAGFALLFGAGWTDMLCAGVCGLLVGNVLTFMGKWKVNLFITTMDAAFLMAMLAYAMKAAQIARNPDSIIIGALMLLVPGLLFTNAMRDILYGDINSGITRLFQVLLIGVAISIGTAVAWNLSAHLWGAPPDLGPMQGPFLRTCLGAAVGCFGFCMLYNIHGPGGLLCISGGVVSWAVYLLCLKLELGAVASYFWASVLTAVYAETMARIRKYPAISYLVVSLFPLVPGSDVYYTMNYAVRGNTEMFARHGMFTAAVAGVIAVATLLVSTMFRMYSVWHQQHRHKKG